MKILIVEDDFTIAEQMRISLVGWGYEVFVTENFSSPMAEFECVNPDLVLMDISLPFYNGFYRCAKIRENSSVPVIFISSAADNLSLITAINMGGDDFIAKPFDLNVLLVKIKALLRRTYEMNPSSAGDNDSNISQKPALPECRGAVYNGADSSLTYQGRKIELTRNESRIINCLLSRRGTIVSRNRIMEELWNDDLYVDENTLSVNVNRLRRKLDEAGLTDFISTKKGQGYIID